MRSELQVLAERARAHHGVVSVADAAELGLTRRHLRRAVNAGILELVHPGVVRFRGTPASRTQLIAAAVLQVRGAIASHESALHLHRIPRMPFALAVTTGPEGPSSRWGVRVHRAGDLVPGHVTTVDGIRVTSLARTVVDLGAVFGPARLAHVVDHLTITDRRTSIGSIARTLEQVNHRGRRGAGRIRGLLDERSPGRPAPRSRTERQVDELVARSTVLPEPVPEHPVPGPEVLGLVDRAWEDARLILEVDGRVWHAREQAMATDRARDRAAAAAGWQTVRILDRELTDDADAVLRDLEATYLTRSPELHRFSD